MFYNDSFIFHIYFQPAPGEEVHGLAFLMDQSSQDQLDRNEGPGYKKVFVDLQAYDGRKLRGFIYAGKVPEGNPLPSKRYMGVIVKVILLKGIYIKIFHKITYFNETY